MLTNYFIYSKSAFSFLLKALTHLVLMPLFILVSSFLYVIALSILDSSFFILERFLDLIALFILDSSFISFYILID